MDQEVKVKITADTTGLERGLAAAHKSMKVFAAAAGAALGAASVAMVALTRQGLDFVDSQAKAARSMDATIDGLRALQLATGEAGIESADLITSMQMMGRMLAQAASEGGPAADMLKAIGLNAADLMRLDADARLAAIADKAKELGLSAQEASRLLQVMGVRSRELGAFVAQGGDAIREAAGAVRDFGLSVSVEMAAQIEATNDAIERMWLVFESLRNQLAAEVAPQLQAVALRFQELSQIGGPLQEAVSRVSSAFGDLAEVLLSEEFINTAATALTGLANALAFVAENANILGPLLGVLVTAMVAMSGPFGAAAAAIGLVVAGFAALKSNGPDAEEAIKGVARGEWALNDALFDYAHTSAPNANAAARDRLVALKGEAKGALAAVEAELALREAMGPSGDVQPGSLMALSGQATTAEMEAERARWKALIGDIRSTIADLNVSGDTPLLPTDTQPPPRTPGTDTPPAVPGIAGAGAVEATLNERLAALEEGLATESETVAAWYEESRNTLDEALAAELLTREEYNAQMERLEEAHQNRLAAIKEMGNQLSLSTALQGGAEILGALGETNKKALKAQKVFAAASAMIDTMQGAAAALKKGVFGFAEAVAVIAKGLGFIAAIKGVNESGGGSVSSGSVGASSSTTQAPPAPTTTFQFTLTNDPMGFGESFARQMIDQLNAAQRNGGTFQAVMA